MRADGIVVFTPRVQDSLRGAHRGEDVAVQTLVPQLPVEAFDEGIVDLSMLTYSFKSVSRNARD
jgi:hypothetical protein